MILIEMHTNAQRETDRQIHRDRGREGHRYREGQIGKER